MEFPANEKETVCPWPLPRQGIDVVLLLVVIGLVLFGLIMVYSSSFIYAQERTGDGFAFIKKQLIFAGLGFGVLVGVCRIDYRRWSKWALPFLGLGFLLLALVLIPGVGARVGGARRWIRLAGFNFQPGELAKFAVIFFIARQLARKASRLHTVSAGIISNFLIPLPAFALLLLQPDFGTTAMISIVIFALLYLAGVPKKHLLAAFGLAAAAGLYLALGTAYRRERIMTFIDPWRDPAGKGFQILQSLVGLHNGSVFGAGLGNGKEKLFYLPEAHNDFIFAVIGEELGFVGIVGVVLGYLFFIYRGLRIAYNCYEKYQDRFGMLLAAGITLALGLQGFVNMSVVLGLLPTKGLTLPFVSYGGSALLVDLFAVGVLLSVARGPLRNKTNQRLLVAGGGTGGHVLAGIAVADAWREKFGKDGDVVFVGARGGIEEKLVPRAGYRLESLRLGSLNRVSLSRKLRTAVQLPLALAKSVWLMWRWRPAAVLGVGGYASGPFLLAAWLGGARTAILEQNSVPGLTNRWLGRVVDRVFCAFPATVGAFGGGKALVTGNPIRNSLRAMPPAPREPFTIFIFGGSLGALGMNTLVIGALPMLGDLAAELRFVHQTGEKDFERVREAYAKSAFASARVEKFIHEMPQMYEQASLLICRAGASTLSEIAAVGRAAILVPLPTAADNHQEKNARIYADEGAAWLLPQTTARGEDLARLIRELKADPGRLTAMESRVSRFNRPQAARDLVEALATDTAFG